MTRPKGIRKLESEQIFESRGELAAFFHAAVHIEKNAVAYALFSMQYLFGLRIGEAVQMRYEHLCAERYKSGDPIYVNAPTLKKRGANGSILTMPVPVLGSPKTVMWCFDRAWRKKLWGVSRSKSPWLFPGRDPAAHMSTKTAIDWFHKCCDSAHLPPGRTPHALRHTAITQVMRGTGDRLRFASAFARHSSRSGFGGKDLEGAQVTRRYIHTMIGEWAERRFLGILNLPDLKPLVPR